MKRYLYSTIILAILSIIVATTKMEKPKSNETNQVNTENYQKDTKLEYSGVLQIRPLGF